MTILWDQGICDRVYVIKAYFAFERVTLVSLGIQL